MAVILGYGLGTLILAAAFVWGIMSYRRRNRANAPVTEEATRDLYKDADGYEERSHRQNLQP